MILHVFWTHCIVHCLNLALKSIASDVTWIGKLIEDARHIHNFVQNHTNALTIYKEYTHLSLLKVANTQFTSSSIVLKWLREVKAALGSMVISEFVFLEKNGSDCFKKGRGHSVI